MGWGENKWPFRISDIQPVWPLTMLAGIPEKCNSEGPYISCLKVLFPFKEMRVEWFTYLYNTCQLSYDLRFTSCVPSIHRITYGKTAWNTIASKKFANTQDIQAAIYGCKILTGPDHWPSAEQLFFLLQLNQYITFQLFDLIWFSSFA